jgi:hypothetical protein
MQHVTPKFVGRNDLETLMASTQAKDWVVQSLPCWQPLTSDGVAAGQAERDAARPSA